MILNQGQCLANLLVRKPLIHRQFNFRLEPKLSFTIRMRHMNVNSRFFPREEKETKCTLAKYGWGHG